MNARPWVVVEDVVALAADGVEAAVAAVADVAVGVVEDEAGEDASDLRLLEPLCLLMDEGTSAGRAEGWKAERTGEL